MLPDFFTGEAQNWRQQASHRFTDAPDRSLRRTPPRGIRGEGVEAVLDHVKIKCAQIDHAEMVDAVVYLVKGKLVIPLAHIADHGPRHPQHVLVERIEFLEGKCV